MKENNIRLIDFVDLSDKQKNIILDMRNHSEVRRWMYNSNLISNKEHLKFIDTLNGKKSKKYFLVTKDKKNIGVIYFTNINMDIKESEFGLYANFFEKIPGAGIMLIEGCLEYAFNNHKLKTLKLEVFNDNEKAISLYNKFNFKQTCKKIVNDHEIICMELNNENR